MENRHFTVIVAGNNPEFLLQRYDANNKSPVPIVVYEFKKAKEYRKKKIKAYEEMLKNKNADSYITDYVRGRLEEIKKMSDTDFYLELTEDYEIDDKTGNAFTYDNPYGKFISCRIGKDFSLPFILKNGEETYQAIKGDVDWEKIHLANTEPYEIAWDTVMENKLPKTEDERTIYNNMKERKYYFSQFGSRENYIASSTAFWGYAFLSNETEWVELEENINQFIWVTEYYDRFIKPLPETTKLTIYECIRN